MRHSKPIKSVTTGANDAVAIGTSVENKVGHVKGSTDVKFGINAKKGLGITNTNTVETPVSKLENNNAVYYNQMTGRYSYLSENTYKYGAPLSGENLSTFDPLGTYKISLGEGSYVETNVRETTGIFADAFNSLSSTLTAYFDRIMHPQKYIGDE